MVPLVAVQCSDRVLLCTTLTVVTVRRIPLRLVNAGVWMIHTGIIVLCIGSYYYFGTKVEGDAPSDYPFLQFCAVALEMIRS